MRKFILVTVLFAVACATTGTPQGFAPDQVWRLKDPQFGGAQVVIGIVEPRGDRRVVHATVAGLPGPESAAAFFSALATQNPLPAGTDAPTNFFMAGFGDDAEWSSLAADISMPADRKDSRITIPHVVVYEQELRRAVSNQVESRPSQHSMFESDVQLWRDNERRWPEFNDLDLKRSLSDRLRIVMRGVAKQLSDPSLMAHLAGPYPLAEAAADEIAVDDPALDAKCREILDPPPLDPKIVAELLKEGFRRDEIPEIDVTLSNITVMQSDRLGHVWRADSVDNRAATKGDVSRTVCWRKTANEQPAVTWYPVPVTAH